MRSRYKTHCFNVYGGEHWLRFLLVLGDVPEEAVDATNEALRERVQEKRGVDPCLDAGPRPPDPEWHWHQRQGRPERPQGPSAKTLRVQARKLAKDLEADKRRAAERNWGEVPAHMQAKLEERAARVQALLDEADRVSEARRFLIHRCLSWFRCPCVRVRLETRLRFRLRSRLVIRLCLVRARSAPRASQATGFAFKDQHGVWVNARESG
ncbi:MAG: hypothetical protein GY772_22705, partial [bacterium]|nr:hypothetical protein [bacterium]